jgi:hypothetical protein
MLLDYLSTIINNDIKVEALAFFCVDVVRLLAGMKETEITE